MRVEGTAVFSGKTLLVELRVAPGTAFDHERLAEIGAAGRAIVGGAEVAMLDCLVVDMAMVPHPPVVKAKAPKAKAGADTGETPVPREADRATSRSPLHQG